MFFTEYWAQAKDFLQGILLDVDGTLLAGSRPMAGADFILQELRRCRMPFVCLTNDCNRSPEEKAQMAQRAGLSLQKEEFVSASTPLAGVLKQRNIKKVYRIGRINTDYYLAGSKIEVIEDPKLYSLCDADIVGEAPYAWNEGIHTGFNFCLNFPERPVIVPNPDSYWPGGADGTFGVGAGGAARFFVNLAKEAGKEPEVIYLGKPYSAIYDTALEFLEKRFQCRITDRKRVLMLGDSLVSDILGANRSGLASGLMLTGITTYQQAQQAIGCEFAPKLVFEQFCP